MLPQALHPSAIPQVVELVNQSVNQSRLLGRQLPVSL